MMLDIEPLPLACDGCGQDLSEAREPEDYTVDEQGHVLCVDCARVGSQTREDYLLELYEQETVERYFTRREREHEHLGRASA